jgi:hypothetical protein
MTVINTCNESSLHKKLKTIYALEYDGKTEQKAGNFICDIITKEGTIIEIQTGAVSPLNSKIEWAVNSKIKIKIVHPVIEEKIIRTMTEEGTLIKTSKSPVKETYFSVLRGLTGVYPWLLNEYFELELINVSITEVRKKTEQKTQLKNKSRRHLKDWIKEDKILNSINSKKIFRTKQDYLNLLPDTLSPLFTPPELKTALLNSGWPSNFTKKNKNDAAKQYGLLIWLLEKTGLIEYTGEKKGRSRIYKIKGVSAD